MRNNPLLRPSLILLLNFLLIFMASGQDKIGIIDFDLIKTRVAQTYQAEMAFAATGTNITEKVAPEIIKMKALIEVVRQWKVELLALDLFSQSLKRLQAANFILLVVEKPHRC